MDKKCEEHEGCFNEVKGWMNRIGQSVDDIKDALLGTYDKKGIISTVKEHDSYIEAQKKTKFNLTNFMYRTVIGIILAYIAIRLDLK